MDLIDRQAAIDALAKFVPYAIYDASTESYANGLTDAYNLICQLPSAQPETKWIPCSERLPNPGYYITSNEYNDVSEDFCYDGHFWKADENAYKVIAWMPLPEPAKLEND